MSHPRPLLRCYPMPGVLIHGPEIGFARALQDSIPDNYILVKATGNIPPAEPNFLWGIDQPYMRDTLTFFNRACGAENVTSSPDAILMAQGIDEALSDLRCSRYKENLFTLIADLRVHFKNPDLPFLIGQSVYSPYADPDRMTFVRQCQTLASTQSPLVGLVSVDDLRPYIRGHHMSSASQLEFGRRFATCLLKLSPWLASQDPVLSGDSAGPLGAN